MDIPEIIKNTVDELHLMKDEPGTNTSNFYANFESDSGNNKHGDHVMQLSGTRPTQYTDDKDKDRLIDQTVKYLESTFMDFNEKPLNCFEIFNLKNWPTCDSELLKYGRDQLCELSNHYQEVLTDIDIPTILREWTVSRNLLCNKKTGVDCFTIYCELLQTQHPDIRNILTLVNIMLTISPSTAECERQFSAMNLIKTSRRTNLRQDTLEGLLRVHADDPSLSDFKEEPAIHHWVECGPGTRHLSGHKC